MLENGLVDRQRAELRKKNANTDRKGGTKKKEKRKEVSDFF